MYTHLKWPPDLLLKGLVHKTQLWRRPYKGSLHSLTARCMKTYSEGTRLDLKEEGEKIYIVLECKGYGKADPPCGKKAFSLPVSFTWAKSITWHCYHLSDLYTWPKYTAKISQVIYGLARNAGPLSVDVLA